MGRRAILSTVGALLLLLTCAASASAASAPRYGWVLQLRNTAFDVRGEDMTDRAFRALVTMRDGRFERSWVDDMKTEDPSDDVTYSGLSLRRLVALIDDGDPATFNKVRAANGYAVVVQAMDGFPATYTSAELMKFGSKIIVADRANGAPLIVPAAELKEDPPGVFSASWKPFWPLKVVSDRSEITGKRKPGGALRISIVPAVDGASRAASAPRYGWVLQLRNTAFDVRGEDMTDRAFRALVTMRDGRFERSWVDDMKTEDPSDDVTYSGLSLRRLVALIDDGDPATFNKVRAANGYAVVVQAMDGFPATYTSAELMKFGSKIIVADRANGAPLIVPAAELKEDPPGVFSASWKPFWPLKVVSDRSEITGKRKPGGALRISIVPLPV